MEEDLPNGTVGEMCMHTVFVNTSGRDLFGNRLDLLGIKKEYNELLCYNCLLTQWFSETDGYSRLTSRIGKQVEENPENGNDYELILYIDFAYLLPELARELQVTDTYQKAAAGYVVRAVLLRMVKQTLLKKLSDDGRTPRRMLLMYGLEEQYKIQYRKYTEENELEQKIVERLLCIARGEVLNSDENAVENWIVDLYKTERDIALVEIEDRIKDGKTEARAIEHIWNEINKEFESGSKTYGCIDCYIDQFRTTNNTSETAKRHLVMQMFLLDCVSNGAFSAKDQPRQIPKINRMNWDAIIKHLTIKKHIAGSLLDQIDNLEGKYCDHGLAPKLYRFENERFGLDANGSEERNYQKCKVDASEADKSEEKTITKPRQEEELVVVKGQVQRWLAEMPRFGERKKDEFKSEKNLLSAEKYQAKAMQLAEHHMDYMRNLSGHVNGIMANYAGKSVEGTAELLRKRTVTNADEESKPCDYQYAPHHSEERRPIEEVRRTAKNSYNTMLIKYLDFCKRREMDVTSLHKECERFINRVIEIEKSLHNMKWVLLLSFVIMTVVLSPFVIIQWDIIMDKFFDPLITVPFLVSPYLVLMAAYKIAEGRQRRKMRKAWNVLIGEHQETIERNKTAVNEYDEFLDTYVPALRWCYEYTLDVDFCSTCNEIAASKINHHREKLRALVEGIRNLLFDLLSSHREEEVDDSELEEYKIDYTRAYCEGDNQVVYTIIDGDMLRSLQEGTK